MSNTHPTGELTPPKAAHVNMMTDTLISSLPIPALRSIIRSLLGTNDKNTAAFHSLVSIYLSTAPKPSARDSFLPGKALEFEQGFLDYQGFYRCLMGVGRGVDALGMLGELLREVGGILDGLEGKGGEGGGEGEVEAVIDGDIVQAITAVQKELYTPSGMRELSEDELKIVDRFRRELTTIKDYSESQGVRFPFQRGWVGFNTIFGKTIDRKKDVKEQREISKYSWRESNLETTKLGAAVVPRIFMGLWQMASPSWGAAKFEGIEEGFRRHVEQGVTAFDMADHYGDAEVTFGNFRSKYSHPENIFCATKWCVFQPTTITRESVAAAITERLVLLKAERIELLQFHWQDYSDKQYILAAKYINEDERVEALGLCNFDTEHMEELIAHGVRFVSNQVQFSLIDNRPLFKMADSCRRHGIKLLTYGSLCGGLLADKWLDKPAPGLFDEGMTPSSRKYLEILNLWGSWSLFQELLQTLSKIGKNHKVSISTVVVRWVLDHEFVGAVIVGARMGVSEHFEENREVFGWRLEEGERKAVEGVLGRSGREGVWLGMGDCGGEYR